jgi:hypothetical protein
MNMGSMLDKLSKSFKNAAAGAYMGKVVDHELFVLESQEIDSIKEAKGYIQGRMDELFNTQNFYYGYVYEDGVLTYYAAVSKSHDDGKIPVYAPAILEKNREERFVFRKGNRTMVVTWDEDQHILCEVNAGYQTGTDLGEYQYEGEIPKTLRLQWSLASSHVNAMKITGIMFVCATAFYAYSAKGYEQITVTARNLAAKQPVAQEKETGLPDLSGIIKDVALKMGEKGTIGQVAYQTGKMQITLHFDEKDNARDFIRKNGGEYDDGKVLLGWAAGDQGGRK